MSAKDAPSDAGNGAVSQSYEMSKIMAWLPPLEDVVASNLPAERLPAQFQNVSAR